MNSLDILAAAAVELLGSHEASVHITANKRDQEAAKRVLRFVKVSAFVAKRVVEKREIRSRLCRKAPAVPVVKKHEPLNLNRLRRQAKRGPAVMMSFAAVPRLPRAVSQVVRHFRPARGERTVRRVQGAQFRDELPTRNGPLDNVPRGILPLQVAALGPGHRAFPNSRCDLAASGRAAEPSALSNGG